jgi:hypothetical protein
VIEMGYSRRLNATSETMFQRYEEQAAGTFPAMQFFHSMPLGPASDVG